MPSENLNTNNVFFGEYVPSYVGNNFLDLEQKIESFEDILNWAETKEKLELFEKFQEGFYKATGIPKDLLDGGACLPLD